MMQLSERMVHAYHLKWDSFTIARRSIGRYSLDDYNYFRWERGRKPADWK